MGNNTPSHFMLRKLQLSGGKPCMSQLGLKGFIYYTSASSSCWLGALYLLLVLVFVKTLHIKAATHQSIYVPAIFRFLCEHIKVQSPFVHRKKVRSFT